MTLTRWLKEKTVDALLHPAGMGMLGMLGLGLLVLFTEWRCSEDSKRMHEIEAARCAEVGEISGLQTRYGERTGCWIKRGEKWMRDYEK